MSWSLSWRTRKSGGVVCSVCFSLLIFVGSFFSKTPYVRDDSCWCFVSYIGRKSTNVDQEKKKIKSKLDSRFHFIHKVWKCALSRNYLIYCKREYFYDARALDSSKFILSSAIIYLLASEFIEGLPCPGRKKKTTKSKSIASVTLPHSRGNIF